MNETLTTDTLTTREGEDRVFTINLTDDGLQLVIRNYRSEAEFTYTARGPSSLLDFIFSEGLHISPEGMELLNRISRTGWFIIKYFNDTETGWENSTRDAKVEAIRNFVDRDMQEAMICLLLKDGR